MKRQAALLHYQESLCGVYETGVSYMLIYFLLPMLVLLPVFPAYILFKLLQATGQLEGTVLGVKLQLGGAFAGYFAVLLVLLNAFKAYIVPPPPPPIENVMWMVKGQVVDENQKPIDATSDNFTLTPASAPPISADKGGQFSINFVPTLPNSTAAGFPTITISYDDYTPLGINLDGTPGPNQPSLTRDDVNHIIRISTPIPLSKAAGSDLHTSEALPTEGLPAKYQQAGSVTPKPPPGYAK